MRTTVDLPDDLLRAAKARAAEHGESLKDLLARAVAREIRVQSGRRRGGRVMLPLIGGDGEAVEMTNADIEAALAAEEADRYGGR
ncbi:MAG TPA: hypothetical protein VOB72_13225 [Candidatus Dormibacteraeota bacterium]|nr:hypothetical protein [Candidatus Dormibacteraeota bacterium]